jgi:hypothetical protein
MHLSPSYRGSFLLPWRELPIHWHFPNSYNPTAAPLPLLSNIPRHLVHSSLCRHVFLRCSVGTESISPTHELDDLRIKESKEICLAIKKDQTIWRIKWPEKRDGERALMSLVHDYVTFLRARWTCLLGAIHLFWSDELPAEKQLLGNHHDNTQIVLFNPYANQCGCYSDHCTDAFCYGELVLDRL